MFPLLLLQTIPDAHQRWTALRIVGAEQADAEALQKLFGPMGLAEACAGLDCLLPQATLAALGEAPVGLGLRVDTGEPAPAPGVPNAHGGPALAILLKLLGQLTSDADTADIEATLKHDPELSVQLLRLVNSVAFAPSKKIANFGQAIALLGRRQLQRWLQLLLYARRGAGGEDNPLLARSAWRGALMEGLCRARGGDREAQDEAFMVGMFSLLEQLFGKPMAEILAPLQLAEPVTVALLQHGGPLGPLLALVEAAEHGLEAVAPALAAAGIDNEAWSAAQVAALGWALQVCRDA